MTEILAGTGYFQSDEEISSTVGVEYQSQYYYSQNSSGVSEITEEEENTSEVFEIKHGESLAPIREELMAGSSLFSLDIQNQNGDDDNSVYVAVGKSDSSVDALAWTLKHAVNPSTFLYLIHVFPEVHHIPTPLGKMPKSRVNRDQVETYMAQERGKRRDFFQRFLNMCSASKVKVDTMLIESDLVAKAILDLIPILNIKKLVLGTNKSNIRKLRSRKGNGIADQLLQNAPESCDVKIICGGKEAFEHINDISSPRGIDDSFRSNQQQEQSRDSFSCICFKPKFI